MASTNHKHVSHVRNACAACHKRKVRCIMSTKGGPCHNCQSTGLPCFFLPRYRSGRPRIKSPSLSDTNIGTTHATTPNSSVSPLSLVSEETVRKPLGISTSNGHGPSDWNWTSATGHLSLGSLSTSCSDQDFTTSNLQMENGFILQDSGIGGNLPEVMNGGFSNLQPDESSESTLLNFPDMMNGSFPHIQPDQSSDVTSLSIDMPTSTWRATSHRLSDCGGNQNEQCREKKFACMLEHCAKLQRHLLRTGDIASNSDPSGSTTTRTKPRVSNSQLREMLGDIDASCKVIFDVFDEGVLSTSLAPVRSHLDFASASLITAMTFKIFQLCDALFDTDVLKSHCLNDVLLHKRLDFNITQARVVTSRIEQLTQSGLLVSQDITKKAAHIGKEFKSTI